MSSMSRTGSPWPRPPGSFAASSVNTFPPVERISTLSIVVRVEGALQPVALLEGERAEIGEVAAHGADPALVGEHDGDRLALDHRLLHLLEIDLRRVGEAGAALAELVSRPERLLHLLDLVGDALPLPLVRTSAAPSRSFFSAFSASNSVRISISSSLRSARSRMLRIASTCTSRELEALSSSPPSDRPPRG